MVLDRMDGSAGKKKNVNPGQINVCSKSNTLIHVKGKCLTRQRIRETSS